MLFLALPLEDRQLILNFRDEGPALRERRRLHHAPAGFLPGGAGLMSVGMWHARRPPAARSHAARGRPRRDSSSLSAGPRLSNQRAVGVRRGSGFPRRGSHAVKREHPKRRVKLPTRSNSERRRPHEGPPHVTHVNTCAALRSDRRGRGTGHKIPIVLWFHLR